MESSTYAWIGDEAYICWDQSYCQCSLKRLQMWKCTADAFLEGMMSRLRVSGECSKGSIGMEQ